MFRSIDGATSTVGLDATPPGISGGVFVSGIAHGLLKQAVARPDSAGTPLVAT